MTLFRLASIVWLVSGIARPLMFLTGAFGFGSAPGTSWSAVLIGTAVCFAIGALLWFRPGRGSAAAAVLFGFYVLPSLLLVQFVGTPPWLIVLAGLGIAAFSLSAICLWRTRSGTAA